MKKLFITAAAVVSALALNAQVFTTGEIQKVKVDGSVDRPIISADGSFVVVQGNGGLEKIDLASGQADMLAKGAGLEKATISADGKTVAYVRSSFDKNHLRHTSLEAVNVDSKKVETIVKASRDLASGVAVTNQGVRALNKGKVAKKMLNKQAEVQAERPVVAIDRGHLMVDGTAIDPQGKGSYLWPSLSPDGTKIVYWCAYLGCFVCNLDGSNVQPVGGLRAAVWAGNDAVIGMEDKDNGEYVTSSKLVAHDLKTGAKQVLTPEDVIAMYPTASTNRVAFVDAEGSLYYMDINK